MEDGTYTVFPFNVKENGYYFVDFAYVTHVMQNNPS